MKYTKEQLLAAAPCINGLRFAASCKFDFQKIWNTCERGDWLIWLLRDSGAMDKTMAVRIAVACAEHVLEKFESKYPEDRRLRRAIEVAQNWLAYPTEENRKSASDYAASAYAAYASSAAAYAYAASAAYLAATAASAADSAAAATAAAATAASAATADYDVSSADCDAKHLSERKWQANKIREIIPCPFNN